MRRLSERTRPKVHVILTLLAAVSVQARPSTGSRATSYHNVSSFMSGFASAGSILAGEVTNLNKSTFINTKPFHFFLNTIICKWSIIN